MTNNRTILRVRSISVSLLYMAKTFPDA